MSTVLYEVEILKKILNFLLSSAFLKYLTRGPQQSILEKKKMLMYLMVTRLNFGMKGMNSIIRDRGKVDS